MTPETLSVRELCEGVRDLLREAIPSVWVAGEIQRVRPNRNGHLFLELVEKGTGDEIVGKLEAVIWRRTNAEVQRLLAKHQLELTDGQSVRCRVSLDFYAPFGRLQAVVQEVDPVFAAGQLELRRRETLLALEKAGLMRLNAGLELSPHPLRIALVTAKDSAAHQDFLTTLVESGFGFEVTLIDAAMQGRDAERSVASALGAASALPVDVCVLVRGGGSKTDLAAFDSRRVCEAVARSAVPVLTGLGHQIDEAIADRVAHTAVKTPTKAAEFLVDRVRRCEEAVQGAANRLTEQVDRRLSAARSRIDGAGRALKSTRGIVRSGATRLEQLSAFLVRTAAGLPRRSSRRVEVVARQLAAAAPRTVVRAEAALHGLAPRLVSSGRQRLEKQAVRLDGMERLVSQLGPKKTLARGYSITRDEEGKVLRRATDVGYGQVVVTQLFDGEVRSVRQAPDGAAEE